MPKQAFNESINNLKTELEKLQPTTSESEAEVALQGLNDSVMKIIEHPGDVPFIHHYDLMNKLKDSATEFEVDHPELTSAISHVIHTLSNIGI